jgi:hypothetical protein
MNNLQSHFLYFIAASSSIKKDQSHQKKDFNGKIKVTTNTKSLTKISNRHNKKKEEYVTNQKKIIES